MLWDMATGKAYRTLIGHNLLLMVSLQSGWQYPRDSQALTAPFVYGI